MFDLAGVAKDIEGFAGLTSRSPPTMASFLAGGASGGRGAFVPRSRALTQCSLRDLLKKHKRPQRLKKLHIGTAAVLRDIRLAIGHCFLLIGIKREPQSVNLACGSFSIRVSEQRQTDSR